MNYERIVHELLKALGVEETEKTFNGTLEVLNNIKERINNDWEEHINKKTDEVLAYNNWRCGGCNRAIEITRTRNKVMVGGVK